jgi:integrase
MAIRKRTWSNAKGEQVAWVVDYRDQTGARRLKTFARKRDAEKWWNGQAGYEIAQGTHTAASASVTVAEAADLWIEHGRAEGLERSTIEQRERHSTLHINPFIGSMKLADLTAPRVNAFLDELRNAGRSLTMRRKVLTSLKALVSHAQGRGLVAQNAARGVRLKGKDREAEGVKMPTKAELRTMLDNAPERFRPLIVTAIFTGLRSSELRGLRWQDVSLDGGVIHVRQRADQWGQIGAPKSKAGRRDVPLAPMVVNALREWRLSCPKGELDLVFPNNRGRPLSHTNFAKRVFRPLQAENGITDAEGAPKFGPHALRHAAASLFIEQGWTPKKVQTVLGHASIQMTFDLYGHLFEDQEGDRQAMEKMQAALLAG